MSSVTDFPLLVFAVALVVLWGSIRLGVILSFRFGTLREDVRKDLETVQAASLTLLGLLIGFAFSMAVSRYEERKTYEEAEANAIGTEYVRADLLPAADGTKVRALLRDYLEQRMQFYVARDAQQVRQINARTARLEAQLWSDVVTSAAAQPTSMVVLAISGMNELFNSRGYAVAARQNRIPVASWSLLTVVAVICALLLGFGARGAQGERMLALVVPLTISVAFLLIAEIDSPASGVIRVIPENLAALSSSLSPR
jgi:hypothetical protein